MERADSGLVISSMEAPAWTRAPNAMSPEIPEKQSKYARRTTGALELAGSEPRTKERWLESP
jgi:hypothetical protein